jgi:hypothetical protein
VIDRHAVPRERVVGADDHLANPGCGHEVTQPLGREHDRAEIVSHQRRAKKRPSARGHAVSGCRGHDRGRDRDRGAL